MPTTPDATPNPDATPFTGLSEAQATARAAHGQGNLMPANKDGDVAAIVRRNVFTLFNLLNCVLAVLLFWVGSYRNLLFMGVVVCNAVIGLIQELRAKRTHDRLLLLSQGQVQTVRDGRETPLHPDELVLGDVVRLRRGDQVPGDATVLRGLADCNEALLTGESDPLPKKRGDTLLSGSYLTEGEVYAELTAVGANSFAGQLQLSARRVKRPRSELMGSLQKLIRIVSILLVPVGIALYLRQTQVLQMQVPMAVTKTVAAAIGMIPEGLMLLTSVALAVGVVRLGAKGTLVNELYGIENLARVDVLCLDKTGTLTSGQMALRETVPLQNTTLPDVTAAMRSFTAAFSGEDSATWQALTAVYPPDVHALPADTVPFSSERKWSAMHLATMGTLVLGAPEKTLPMEDGALQLAQTHASHGLRVLALSHTNAPLNGKTLPSGLTPIALLLLSDTLRPDAAQTLRYFHEQGVAIKVISGDSAATVSHIAAQAGLVGAQASLDCATLSQPPDYDQLARDYTVFGRVSPEDKRALIDALKRQGHTVGMVGDGVNDVPALKAADCSIAMAGGSDAAARVAQLTLLGGDFSVVPAIVLEGRRVINNITRASALYLVKNIFSFLLAVTLLVLPFAYPFAPIQLTLVSTLTIGFPSFVLALQPNRERVHGRFLQNMLARAIPGGVTVFTVCIGMLLAGRTLGLTEQVISTLCTLCAAFSGLYVLALTCRPMDWIRAALTMSMAVAMVCGVLVFPTVFYLVPIPGSALWLLLGGWLLVLCLLPLLVWAVRIWQRNDAPTM